MKKHTGKIIIGCIVVLLLIAAMVAPLATAAVTTQNVLMVSNAAIKDYTYVYVQVFSLDGVQVYDTTANSSTGGFTARADATYANTDIEVAVDADFYIGEMKLPSNITGSKIVRLMGSTDATADKDDTQISCSAITWHTSGGITKFDAGVPVSF
jgi:hypothetical protein